MKNLILTTFLLLALFSVQPVNGRTDDGTYICPTPGNSVFNSDLGVWTGQKCQSCYDQCTSCDPSTYWSRCTSDQSTSYGISGCINGCQSSGTKTQVCTQCNAQEYFQDSGLCVQCPSDCETCGGKSSCDECKDGFYLYNSQCIEPTSKTTPSNCAKWSSDKECKKCLPGYFLKSATLCVQCSSNCYECDTETTCQSCWSSYYINSTGQCTTCGISNCSECNLEGTSVVCKTCNGSFYLKDTQTCTAIDAKCETFDTTTPTKCLVCRDGYYLDSANACQVCSSLPGAWRCKDNKFIIQCQEGFALMEKSTTDTTLVCNKIDYMANPRLTYCRTFKTPTVCGSCYNDYILDKGSCIKCEDQQSDLPLGPGCNSCSAGTDTTDALCSACADGYYLPTSTTKQCALCTGNTVSLACRCGSDGQCTECLPGFYSKPGQTSVTCLSCSDGGCASCDPAQPHICTSCQIGFYLRYSQNSKTQTSCEPCGSMNGCIECSYWGTCTKCDNGRRLDPNTKSCISTGVRVSDGIKPLSCQLGFVLENDVCKLCYVDGVSKCPTSCTDSPSSGGGNGTTKTNSSVGVFSLLISLVLVVMASI